MDKTELLSPAGSFDAALAAFQNGANAIYLGLTQLSARAEATNFTPQELIKICNYAHNLTPRRNVYVALNTCLRQSELPTLLNSLDIARTAEADGIILQDLAILTLIKNSFPMLPAHASTQMAIHNLDGALELKDLGFSRVVLARELSQTEIIQITQKSGIEVEVFIHGALCYSYSGLCLFSALQTGRSGNRGRCAYCCRSRFKTATTDSFPYSMKDLCLLDSVRDLQKAGVSSLKIEGRMKNPLYVATVTNLYRKELDGLLTDHDTREEALADMRSVFSRPITRLHFDSKSYDVIDDKAVGHRGTPIGKIKQIHSTPKNRYISITPTRPLEIHDGLQIEGIKTPNGRPYGFSIETLRLSGENKNRFEIPANSRAEILLPKDAPHIPNGAQLYLTSSQAVHRKFAITRPRETEFQANRPLKIDLTLTPNTITTTLTDLKTNITQEITIQEPLEKSTNPQQSQDAAHKNFSRLGDTNFKLQNFTFTNPHDLYLPPKLANEIRRQGITALEEKLTTLSQTHRTKAQETLSNLLSLPPPATQYTHKTSVKVPLNSQIDLTPYDNTVIALTLSDLTTPQSLLPKLEDLQTRSITLSLPIIIRTQETSDICKRATTYLISHGYTSWEIYGLGGLHILRDLPTTSITADMTLYALNNLTLRTIISLGISAVVAPAEATPEDLATLRGPIIIPTRLRPPLFIGEVPPLAHGHLTDRQGAQYTQTTQDGITYTRSLTPIFRSPSSFPTHSFFREDYTDLLPK